MKKLPALKVPYTEELLHKLCAILQPKYERLKWTWFIFEPGARVSDEGIPGIKRLEATYRNLIETVTSPYDCFGSKKNPDHRASTGGLVAEQDSSGVFLSVDYLLRKLITQEEIGILFARKPRRMLRYETTRKAA
jgi:hypothetical protein